MQATNVNSHQFNTVSRQLNGRPQIVKDFSTLLDKATSRGGTGFGSRQRLKIEKPARGGLSSSRSFLVRFAAAREAEAG